MLLASINFQSALPSLEGINRAVEQKMGIALLPRRCALAEIARRQLVAVKIPEVRLPRQVRLVYRKGELSHAAAAFLTAAKAGAAVRVEGQGVRGKDRA